MQLLLQKKRVGAERYELLARNNPFDDLADLAMDQRFAARNGHHGGPALVDGVETFLDRQAPVEDRVRVIDLAAARAGKIAAEQRLEHQHERIPLAAHQLLLEQIGADPDFFMEGYDHDSFTLLSVPSGRLGPCGQACLGAAYPGFSPDVP